MRFWLLHAAALVGLLSVTGCSRSLGRDDVARLLQSSGGLQKTSYFRLAATEEIAMDPERCRTYNGREVWHSMVNLGLGTVQVSMTSSGGLFPYYECRLQLTPSGKVTAGAWKSWRDPLGTSGWEIPVATLRLGGVTGVSQGDGAAVAQAEYTYRWVPTDAARKLGIIPDGTLRAERATLQRFDDGWRVQSVGLLDVADPRLSIAVAPPPRLPEPEDASAYAKVPEPGKRAFLGRWVSADGMAFVEFLPGDACVLGRLEGGQWVSSRAKSTALYEGKGVSCGDRGGVYVSESKVTEATNTLTFTFGMRDTPVEFRRQRAARK
jgi:hypothetical protein